MASPLFQRLTAIILTYNRAAELQRTLDRMLTLEEVPSIIVVDNGSGDGTASMLRHYPCVRFIQLEMNIGAAARNAGVEMATTPYIAFCDDDTWWGDGALGRAADLLDVHSELAVLCARVLVGPEQREDPTCAQMAASPLPSADLPGPSLLGFLAGASVMRRSAFLEAGGYEPRFFIGGEESLLALDLAARGWKLVYAPQLTVHHFPSLKRDDSSRRKFLARNALWVAWLRLPVLEALRQTMRIIASAYRAKVMQPALREAIRALPWILRRRRVLPPEIVRQYRSVHG